MTPSDRDGRPKETSPAGAAGTTGGALELDELLRHRSFLHTLVRRILADEQGVEDVLQETWLRALEQPPSKLSSLRAWLASVARNAAFRRMRDERHGRAREQRSARPEAMDVDASDTAQKLERQSQVLAAVTRLGEPRRTAIHLRYFEGKEPAEIAHLTNASIHTVNDRLRTGRRELRRELERTLGIDVADRGALALYLLPIAGLPREAVRALELKLAAASATAAATATAWTGTAATTTPSLLTGLVMSKKILIAATIAACLVGLRFTLGDERAPAVREPEAPTARAQAPESEPVLRTVEASTVPEVVEEPVEHAREVVETTVAIRGVVEDGRGLRREGVRLVARLWRGYERVDAPLSEVELASASDGSFAWSPVRPASEEGGSGGAFCVDVGPRDERFSGYGDEQVVAKGASPRPMEVRVFPLDLVVRGRVEDTQGNPIEGATVTAERSATTDEHGDYEVVGSTQSVGEVRAAAPGFASKRVALVRENDAEARVDFVLDREFRIFGRVTDERGRPVEGVRVTTFFSSAKDNYATSAADGTYELGGLEPGRKNHNLYGRREGFIEATANVETAPSMRVEQDLVMRVGTRVEGRVVDARGEPVAGAALYIGFSPNAYDRIDAVAGSDGRFVFPHVKPGEQTIGTNAEGLSADRRTFTLAEGTKEYTLPDIVLSRGRTIEGVVLGPDGGPIAGVWVSPRYQDEWIDERVETDTDGLFLLEALPATDVELSFYSPSKDPLYARYSQALPNGEVEPLEVHLVFAGRLAGRVVDGRTGEPVTNFTIRLETAQCPDAVYGGGLSATWVREGYSFSSADGMWDSGTSLFSPGSAMNVIASAPGFASGTYRCAFVDPFPDPEALVIELFPGGRIVGRVTDRDGTPLAGAVVKRSRTTVINPWEPHDVEVLTTDAGGTFEIDDVPFGRASLLIEHPNWTRTFRHGPITLSESEPVARPEIRIGAGATITGIALDESGAPLVDHTIELKGEASETVGDVERSVVTGTDGRFVFDDVSDGHYIVEPAKGARLIAHASAIVLLRDGVSQEVRLGPPSAKSGARLTGTLVSSGALPALPVRLVLVPASLSDVSEPIVGWGAIATDGSFSMAGLPLGAYQVAVDHTDPSTGAKYGGMAQVELGADGAHVTVEVGVRPPERRDQ